MHVDVSCGTPSHVASEVCTAAGDCENAPWILNAHVTTSTLDTLNAQRSRFSLLASGITGVPPVAV